jgi:hypothetical protein
LSDNRRQSHFLILFLNCLTVPGDTVEEAETVYYKIFVIMENKKWNDVLLEWVSHFNTKC